VSERDDAPGPAPTFLPQVGLCSICRHGQRQENPRGSTFWRCRKSDLDPAFRRYPPLPVASCAGHEPIPGQS